MEWGIGNWEWGIGHWELGNWELGTPLLGASWEGLGVVALGVGYFLLSPTPYTLHPNYGRSALACQTRGS